MQVGGDQERITDPCLSAVDVDITHKLHKLKTKVTHQASICVAARVLSASVLDFLRQRLKPYFARCSQGQRPSMALPMNSGIRFARSPRGLPVRNR